MSNRSASDRAHDWALVLAAGEGSRLRELTTTHEGVAIPKQFCSLRGRRSLLRNALDRAATISPRERICAVVAAEHRSWWSVALRECPRENVIAQVRNKGTAIGILLPLLRIVERDPDASLVVLPSDHYVGQEATLTQAMRTARDQLARDPDAFILLGIEPDELDTELGYIVPAATDAQGPERVAEFAEKPDAATVVRLLQAGAMWNSFIFAVKARALLERFRSAGGEWVRQVATIAALDPFDAHDLARIVAVYDALPNIDFSRAILQAQASSLSVMRVPACGWSDLGTPHRVAQTLSRVKHHEHDRVHPIPSCAFLELSARMALA